MKKTQVVCNSKESRSRDSLATGKLPEWHVKHAGGAEGSR